MKPIIFLTVFFFAIQSYSQTFNKKLIQKHIVYLASDKLQGRAPGTEGEKLAAKYIAKYYKKLGLIPKGLDGYFQSFDYTTSKNPHDSLSIDGKYVGKNVLGFLDNKKDYTVIIGAHYDHLGMGDRGSSLEANSVGKIHNGADDNASGVAGVLELARLYSKNGITENYNFLFICFSAEEAGLIGSKYYSNHPSLDHKSIQAMINMDMIGRLNPETKKLMVYGVGTSPSFVNLIAQMKSDLSPVTDSSGTGPSDHTSFYLKNIPVLHFFTGQHMDYHKPGDDAEKINYPGEIQVLEFIKQTTDKLLAMEKLPFLETRSKEGRAVAFKISLGVMPDYSFGGPGMRVDGVTKGRPADGAGIVAGDIILKIADLEIKDIYVYMEALAKLKKGETADIQVQRGTEKLNLKASF